MNDKKNPLKVIQEPDEAPHEVKKKTKPEKEATGKPSPAFELPEGYLLAQEMQEMFDEDIVTHVQGSSEPEAD